MTTRLLERLFEQRKHAAQQWGDTPLPPCGIAIDDLAHQNETMNEKLNNHIYGSSMLLIPPGIGSRNMGHFMDMKEGGGYLGLTVNVVEDMNDHYPEDDPSFTQLLHRLKQSTPTLLIAGSRGTSLLTRMLLHAPTAYKGTLLVLGPVHLRELIDTLEGLPNRLVIVHGTHDPNERIEHVRRLVASCVNATLVEATNKSHDMGFDQKETLVEVIEYVLKI